MLLLFILDLIIIYQATFLEVFKFVLLVSYKFFHHFKVLLEAMKENQIVVISGETGCGKTTQVRSPIINSL